MNRKIRVFLGGYVNSQNAQNINCRSLSENLDKNRFEVWTMKVWHPYPKGNDFQPSDGVHYIYDTPASWTEKLHLPYWLFAWMGYAIGIIRCDVAYLPKGEYVRFCHIIAKIFNCKLFTTLEGVLRGSNISKISDVDAYIDNFRRFEPNLYAITKFMATAAEEDFGLTFNPKTLYLGVNAELFRNNFVRAELKNVVLIGNNLKFKGIDDFLRMAELFPELDFHIIGGGDMSDRLRQRASDCGNLYYHGVCDHTKMAAVLSKMDLMYFPSRSEGFPKVMLETACAGVPTLCYGDYGADEWITTGVDGFVVNTFDDAKEVIQDLYDHPEKLRSVSKAAIELGKRFDWKILVKDWEEEIENMLTAGMKMRQLPE